MEFNDDLIANFCSITGSDEQNAQHFLAASEGDLETAISLFLDSSSTSPVIAAGASGSTPVAMGPAAIPDVRAPIEQKRSVLVDNLPPMTARHVTYDHIEPFRDFSTENVNSSFSSPFYSDSTPPMDEHGRRLARLFRPPMEIMFPGGNFDAARKAAREAGKWLLITLHCPNEFPCQQMIRDVWNEAPVQEFIQESLIFLFLTTDTTEGRRYEQYYPVDAFPHWALIDPRTGKRVRVWSRPVPTMEVLQDLVDYVIEHPFVFNLKRTSPNPVEVITIDDSDKRPITSAASGSPATISKKSKSDLPVAAQSASVVASAEFGRVDKATVGSKVFNLPEEPSIEDKSAITVQIRMSDGRRHRRRFNPNDTASDLFNVVRDLAIGMGDELDDFELSLGPTNHSIREPAQGPAGGEPGNTQLIGEMNLRNATLTVVFLK